MEHWLMLVRYGGEHAIASAQAGQKTLVESISDFLDIGASAFGMLYCAHRQSITGQETSRGYKWQNG
jgi:hypothetical protein